MTDTRPIADGLWTDEADPRLIAGRRFDDGVLLFPMPTSSEADSYEPVPLPRTGKLWSWTIQSFRPKSPPYAGPEAFEPYAVGYVALGDLLIVEGRLTCIDGLEIGMDMTLTFIPFGNGRMTYAFAPAGAA